MNRFKVRKRAVRLVQEHRGEYPSLWAAIESIAPKIGCVPQGLNEWVRKHKVDSGTCAGVKTDERERINDRTGPENQGSISHPHWRNKRPQ